MLREIIQVGGDFKVAATRAFEWIERELAGSRLVAGPGIRVSRQASGTTISLAGGASRPVAQEAPVDSYKGPFAVREATDSDSALSGTGNVVLYDSSNPDSDIAGNVYLAASIVSIPKQKIAYYSWDDTYYSAVIVSWNSVDEQYKCEVITRSLSELENEMTNAGGEEVIPIGSWVGQTWHQWQHGDIRAGLGRVY